MTSSSASPDPAHSAPVEAEEHESYVIKGGLKVTERFFLLPLDYSKPSGEKITVFARHVVPLSKAKTKEEEQRLPFFVYLNGGPGMESSLNQATGGYANELYEQGYQGIWLDQRGTGLSTALSPDTLPAHVKTDEQIATYLKHFRADSIVNDCEAIRHTLLSLLPEPQRKWTLVGQSFGGFCALHYLSFYPAGVKEAWLTGGMAPLGEGPDEVYERLAVRVMKRNQVYYKKYPQDVKRVRDILAFLETNDVRLPDGGRLSPSRWQQLGIDFGAHGGIDRVHQLVFRASKDLALFHKLSYKLLQTVQQTQTGFDANPLYAILHEPLYCQGQAPNWSAARAIQKLPQFSWGHVKGLAETEPVYFTGEMIFPDMFDDYAGLRPWKGAAEILAKDNSWGRLYDLKQLGKNEVKVSAVTYFNDMYVDFDLAQDTAARMANTEQYITNQLMHNGIREDSKDIMKRLVQISKREFD